MIDRYLFRGKRVDNDEWVYGGIYYQSKNKKFYIIGDSLHGIGRAYEVIPETIGPCMGLKDNNGKLIFKGDIVEYYSDYEDTLGYSRTTEYYGVIIWNTTKCCWSIKMTDDKIIPFNDYDWDVLVVIGNIHDNPELLEVNKNGK